MASISRYTVAALNIEPHSLLHTQISLCCKRLCCVVHCALLQLDVSSSIPPFIGPSNTSKMVNASILHCSSTFSAAMVQARNPFKSRGDSVAIIHG
jgi:hypothetical protein